MREKLTNARHVNSLLMKFAPSKKELLFLVEGKFDKILFKKFILEETISLESCSGYFNLLEIVEELRKRDFFSFIAVLDSDFRNLEGSLIKDDQIFFTDFHDIEVSFIESRSLNVILEKYAVQQKLDTFQEEYGDSYKNRIYKLISHLGFLKWANKNEKLGLAFKPEKPEGKKLKLEKFIKTNMEFEGETEMINYIRQYSQNRKNDTEDVEKIAETYLYYRTKKVDFKHLCNGHDLCYAISISLKKAIGNSSVLPSQIEDDLRLAYDSSCFKKTNLYKEIEKWENNNIKVFA